MVRIITRIYVIGDDVDPIFLEQVGPHTQEEDSFGERTYG
jgi:hypothetical protein